jgi:hypothetical protein
MHNTTHRIASPRLPQLNITHYTLSRTISLHLLPPSPTHHTQRITPTGHYGPNQDVMREQPNNSISINLLDDFVLYLQVLLSIPCILCHGSIFIAVVLLCDEQPNYSISINLLDDFVLYLQVLLSIPCILCHGSISIAVVLLCDEHPNYSISINLLDDFVLYVQD